MKPNTFYSFMSSGDKKIIYVKDIRDLYEEEKEGNTYYEVLVLYKFIEDLDNNSKYVEWKATKRSTYYGYTEEFIPPVIRELYGI